MSSRMVVRRLVLVDGANLWHTTESLGYKIDFNKFRHYFTGTYFHLVDIRYYTGLDKEPDGRIGMRPLVDWLEDNNYTVITKMAKAYINNHNERRVKGNLDIEITCDAIELSQHVDEIILVTGDGDFVPLVNLLKMKGKRVKICSSRNANILSQSLRRVANELIDLADPSVRGAIENLPT